MTDIQSTLARLAKENDQRTSVFEVEIQELKNSTVTLSGRLLDRSQLEELHRLFPNLKLDTALIRVLDAGTHEFVHVATSLTGLYERPTFNMPLSSELTYGTTLEVLDEKDNWVFTRQTDGYLGWVYRPYLSEGPAPAATHLVLTPSTELHTHPEESSPVLTRLVSGTGVVLQEINDDWARVQAHRSGWMRSSGLRSLAGIPSDVQEKRTCMASDAMRMIGVPYLWGGTSGNGIDCSGFARLLHRWVGVDIPRDADMQYQAAFPVEPPYETGDLFFFGEGGSGRKVTHVGVSLSGWRVIHASRGNNGVYIDDLQEKWSLRDSFVRAGSFLRQK